MRWAAIEKNLKEFDETLTAYRAEMASEFKKALSAAEERQLEEFGAEEHRLQMQLKEISKKRLELEGRKKSLETELRAHLRPQEDQLRSQAFENSATGGSGSFKDAQKELKKLKKAAAEVDRQLQENEKTEGIAAEIAELEAHKAQKEQEQQELQKRIDQYQKKLEKNSQTKARLLQQAAEYAKNIRDLGILPEEAFGKLRKANEALKKYKHINKKAFDQYNNFTTQREQLLKRRKELDTSQKSIEELIQHLDHAKDEAIERTFKQVSREFSTIFEKLVPAGHGRLVIQRKAAGSKNRNPEDSDEDGPSSAKGVESYSGVGISVSFNSKVMDEQQKIQQLSGGQKSMLFFFLILTFPPNPLTNTV
ncbi:hypothetical protein B0T13DRAFT_516061 [Neurospora crassa]|nr:hypothetical protein B0T13DRAFT_516061 [Neurospora crassa]